MSASAPKLDCIVAFRPLIRDIMLSEYEKIPIFAGPLTDAVLLEIEGKVVFAPQADMHAKLQGHAKAVVSDYPAGHAWIEHVDKDEQVVTHGFTAFAATKNKTFAESIRFVVARQLGGWMAEEIAFIYDAGVAVVAALCVQSKSVDATALDIARKDGATVRMAVGSISPVVVVVEMLATGGNIGLLVRYDLHANKTLLTFHDKEGRLEFVTQEPFNGGGHSAQTKGCTLSGLVAITQLVSMLIE